MGQVFPVRVLLYQTIVCCVTAQLWKNLNNAEQVHFWRLYVVTSDESVLLATVCYKIRCDRRPEGGTHWYGLSERDEKYRCHGLASRCGYHFASVAVEIA